ENSLKAMNSEEAMAEYAGKLFDFGHEGRALVAYQQIIYKAPLIFDRYPIHLWNLSEIHLGQGNLSLANGYYQSLIEKHPDHPLSAYAKMRKLDITAAKAWAKRDPAVQTHQNIHKQLKKIKTDHPELIAQLAIRDTWWRSADKNIREKIANEADFLPKLTAENNILLQNTIPHLENPKTKFISMSLMLNQRLHGTKTWDSQKANMAANYLNQWRGKKTLIYKKKIVDELTNQLNDTIQKLIDQGKYLAVVEIFENLPKSLKSLKRQAKTNWSIGESYRNIGQPGRAIPFYKMLAVESNDKNRLAGTFRYLMAQIDHLEQSTWGPAKAGSKRKLKKTIMATDKKLKMIWDGLNGEEKRKTFAALKSDFEEIVMKQTNVQTIPDILLEAWTKKLSTEQSTADPGGTATDTYKPSIQTLNLLIQLKKKFQQLGQRSKKSQVQKLIARLKPTVFEDDKKAANQWIKEIRDLAEDYRKNNQFLQAGRTYALLGNESPNWEGRAEALYKGGLLLYRAGKRTEAISAFESAAQDGNSLLYADLAQKRLDQLKE
ncbi:MAG: hypothetical protein CMP10_20460, partial [Zetaproteobacteria bacterium]|nr:hypothetical protein [Pseudobdellovibrionaceae bacterium]